MRGPLGTGDIFIFLEVDGATADPPDDPFLVEEAPDLGETPLLPPPPPPDLTEVTDPDLSRGDRLELRLDDRELAGLDRALPRNSKRKGHISNVSNIVPKKARDSFNWKYFPAQIFAVVM